MKNKILKFKDCRVTEENEIEFKLKKSDTYSAG